MATTVIDQLVHGKIACLWENTSRQQQKGSPQHCYFPAKVAEQSGRHEGMPFRSRLKHIRVNLVV